MSRRLKHQVYRASQHHLVLEKLSAKAELISASPYLERYSIVSTAIFKGNLVMHALTQSNINKAHVVLQSLQHAPANTPLTGVINTKRPKMTQKQKVASYLKSVEGNPNTDAYKIRAKEASSKVNAGTSNERREWVDHELPLVENRRTAGQSKRAAGCNSTDKVFTPPECIDRYFDEYKNSKARSAPPLAYDLIGGGDPECTCINQLPEFIVCSDRYFGYTIYDRYLWPEQILDYRNATEKVYQICPGWKTDCPEPAATHDDIMLQIDETLKQSLGTRTYLNQSLLDDYLDWRKANGTADGFQYIRVADKEAAAATTAAGQPGALNDGSFVAWMVCGLGALGMIGAGTLAKISNMKYEAAIRNIVASTSTPPHSAPTVRVASPSSMGSVSTTVPQMRNPKPSSPSAGQPVGTADAAASHSNSSDDSSDAHLSAVVIDRVATAPAGHEDD